MENNFDLTSYLKKNTLLKENIGGYRDITPLNELGNSGYESMADNWKWHEEEAEELAASYKAAREKEAAEKAEKEKKDKEESINEKDYSDWEDEGGMNGMGWQDDDDEEQFPDEREMFLGQGGQEILDKIKYLVGTGFPLQDIMKQIRQHSNYIQGPTLNKKYKQPMLEDDDSSLFGPNIEKSIPGNLSDYYRNAEPQVKHVANELDEILDVLVKDKSRLEELTDLIVALSDAYAEERIDLYNSDDY